MSMPLVSLNPSIPVRRTTLVWFIAIWLLAFWTFGPIQPSALGQTDKLDPAAVQFFEQRIRPVLVKHCLECHSVAEASGGLRLDSREGWQTGGDSGPAIAPGDLESSLLWRAISYEDPDLQMPPSGKLTAAEIQDVRSWILNQAVDPRDAPSAVNPPSHAGLAPADAHQHWAYRPVNRPSLPNVASDIANPIDRFIEHQLLQRQLTALPPASTQAIWRRLHFDLSGLPPEFPNNLPPDARSAEFQQLYQSQIEHLLADETFGQTFARHWMDVVRYADSVTLRGFVLPNAWRYRDYLIESYNTDKPFDQMILEQIAGDHLATPTTEQLLDPLVLQQYRQQLVATTFLTLGNTNLETQDKRALELDYIDEQLDVIGQTFLAQTISCARCHDHKFDPIPTRDYYAMAGIFDGSIGLIHDNVSTWVEASLPLSPTEARAHQQLTENIAQAERQLQQLKSQLEPTVEKQRHVSISTVAGIVVDDQQAQLVGRWVESQHTAPFLEAGYRHDEAQDRGQKTATFQPTNLPPGLYDVRIAYSKGDNRATNAMVDVFSADGQATKLVNQRLRPNVDGLWHSLGRFRFEANGQAYVMISNQNADGHVIIDAVQFLPQVASDTPPQVPAEATSNPTTDQAKIPSSREAELRKEISQREEQLRTWQRERDAQPKFMTLNRKPTANDLPIMIRGDHKRPGPLVPRGFLSANGFPTSISVKPDSDGRLELAQWLTARDHPLTARVYANRIWSWLMGRGLVGSLNNFGTTGDEPTHPELLDFLACELIDSGWSTKHLVRLIVTSNAYQRHIANTDADATSHDSLYASGYRRRLSVEALRDAMLLASGELDVQTAGSSIKAGTVADYDYPHQSLRRSVYQSVFRNSLPPLFREFDFADPGRSVGQRNRSTLPAQSLMLMNSAWVTNRAQATARRLRENLKVLPTFDNGDHQLVEWAYQACLRRSATDEEIQTGVQYLTTINRDDPDPLVDLVQALFASLEFRFLE